MMRYCIVMICTIIMMLTAMPVQASVCDVSPGIESRDYRFIVTPVDCAGASDEVSMMLSATLNASHDDDEAYDRRFTYGGSGACGGTVEASASYTWGEPGTDLGDRYPLRMYSCHVRCDYRGDSENTYFWEVRDSYASTLDFPGGDDPLVYHSSALQSQFRFDCQYGDVAQGETTTKIIEVGCTYVTPFYFPWLDDEGVRQADPNTVLCDMSANSSGFGYSGPLLNDQFNGGITANDYNSYFDNPNDDDVQGIVRHVARIPVTVTGTADGTVSEPESYDNENISIDWGKDSGDPGYTEDSSVQEDGTYLDRQDELAKSTERIDKESTFFNTLVMIAETIFSFLLLMYYLFQLSIVIFVFTEWIPAIIRSPATIIERVFLNKGGGSR